MHRFIVVLGTDLFGWPADATWLPDYQRCYSRRQNLHYKQHELILSAAQKIINIFINKLNQPPLIKIIDQHLERTSHFRLIFLGPPLRQKEEIRRVDRERVLETSGW